MSEEILKQFMKKISDVQHKYCGVLDENGFRVGTSCQQWFNQSFVQEYSGQFLYNNIQNKGIYLIDKKGDQAYYDGLFYCNKLEGYGKVIYANSTVFEGLFKQHLRFGPGVLTYSDNTQDVGMWDGYVLRRIMVSMGGDFVPRLSRTSFGKAILLKFRDLIPICVKIPDPAKDILSQLTDDEEIISQSDELYNLHVRNPESLFFNKTLYCANFAKEDCTIDVVISQEEFEESSLRSQTRLEDESVADESIEDYSYVCCCFQPNLDRFGHMCMQLNEVEVKLEALAEKIECIKQQFRTCKYCCENMPWESLQEIDKIKISHSRQSSARHSQSKKRKSEKQKVLSFRSSSQTSEYEENGPQNNQHRHEVELQNYFYTDSIVNVNTGDERNSLCETFSKVTLPFSQETTSASDFTTHIRLPDIDYNLGDDDNSEEYEQADFTQGFPTCLCNEKLVENIHMLQKKLESLLQEELFYTAIKNHLKNHVDIEFEKLNSLERKETQFFRKVVITDLLAWNNEEIWIGMLKHCFHHRSSEENVSFVVRDLLVGQRHLFKNPGIYETNCMKFLEECSEGNETSVFSFIRRENVNPDLCDARGNTGIMLATVRDKTNVITVLANCGAKLDVMNDEGLTPLSISFLKYISFKFRVTDWEKAFLAEAKPTDEGFQQWCPADSLISMYDNLLINERIVNTTAKSQSVKLINNFGNISTDKTDLEVKGEHSVSEFDSKTMMMMDTKNKQKYVFNVEYIYVPHEESEKDKKKNKEIKKKKNGSKVNVTTGKVNKDKKKHKKEEKKNDKKHNEEKEKEDLERRRMDEKVAKKLISVKNTILTLLKHGSDPNVGEVPLKSIFLAVFTDDSDLMYGLLKNNADPNTVMANENLTSLHLIVSLSPTLERVRMCQILLNFDADPNIKTDSSHWPDIGRQVLGEGFSGVPNEGKNALHLLGIREDFVYDSDNFLGMMASILVFKGCKVNDLYLGHTPLSLAVLRGNVNLIKILLDTKQVDPHQLLGNDMGNALTVLILNRFISSLPVETKKLVATVLINNGLNPLNRVGAFENVIAFIEHESELTRLARLSSKMLPKSKQKDRKNKTKQKSSKKSTSNKSLKKASSKVSSRSFKKRSKSSSKKLKGSSSSISDKKKKKDRSETQLKPVENYVTEISRKILFRHIQAKAVENLYAFVLESLIADPMIVVLTKFFTPQEALNILPLLFLYGRLTLEKLDFCAIYNFVTFIKIQHNMDPDLEKYEIEKIDNILKMQSMKNVKKLPRHPNFILPEVDEDVDKYQICYGCLRSEGKRLLKCPSCELVYFCSEKCNNLSDKFDNYHYCKVLFYDAVDNIIGLTQQPSRLNILLDMANRMRKERTSVLKCIFTEEKKLKQKLKTVKDTVKSAQIIHELKELEKERKSLTYSCNLWDYGIVPSIGNKQVINKSSKSSSSLPKSTVFSDRDFKLELAPKVDSVDAVQTSVLRSMNFLPTLQAPTSTKNDDIQHGADYKSTDKDISSHLNAGPRNYRRKSSPVHDSGHTSTNVFLTPKPRRFSYSSTNKQLPMAKIFARTLENAEFPANDTPFNREPELKRSMIVKKEGKAEKARLPNKNYYMELLSKIFADFNLPLLLLPYACYKDGQVYYKMSGNSSYFGFHKLKIPD